MRSWVQEYLLLILIACAMLHCVNDNLFLQYIFEEATVTPNFSAIIFFQSVLITFSGLSFEVIQLVEKTNPFRSITVIFFSKRIYSFMTGNFPATFLLNMFVFINTERILLLCKIYILINDHSS